MPEWIEIAIRSTGMIFSLFFITKILGKKQLSKLSFFEYIVGIIVGDIAGTISMDVDLHLINGITSILIWFFVLIVIEFLVIRSKTFRKVVEGTSTPFIKNGEILEGNLKKERYTAYELLEQLRKKDVLQVEDVEFATLETNGDLSVFLKKEKQPVTREDLFGLYPPVKIPQTIILEGKWLKETLVGNGWTEEWLMSKLQRRNVKLKDIFLAQLDSEGELYIDFYGDGGDVGARHQNE
ncbi:DUF421 domain-containing protein [Metabacillus arenae]|uniref:DUF421 domain-containing protein n=1 Tax=Metabacillus arenae TaxID=2771434 RepID=A0A926S2F0_9BACI|nr:DUF421 domain-containing protein [Metabacillus arenae]MBD1381949.1 DUF421 domain-containing protein [Metabacillus arenae]